MAGVDLGGPAWMAAGACTEHPEVEFVPGDQRTEQNADMARAICGRCVASAECLAYAMADPILVGIWGGTTSAERRAMRKRRAA